MTTRQLKHWIKILLSCTLSTELRAGGPALFSAKMARIKKFTPELRGGN
jgi:hypothetical protein